MKRRSLIPPSLVSMLALLALPIQVIAQEQQGAHHLQHYRVTDLGTLGGTSGLAYGINDRGRAAGAANLVANGPMHAFISSRDGLTDLGTLGGPNSVADGPNISDELAIYSETSVPAYMNEDFCGFGNHLRCLAAVWRRGKMIPLPTLPGGDSAQAIALNNRGQLVGLAETGTLETPGYCASPAQVLDFVPVIWGTGPDEIRRLPPLPGDTVGVALAVNDKGEVVGTSGLCSNTTANGLVDGPHAVIWEADGSVTDLGNLGSSTVNVAAGINNRGEVVGGSVSAEDGNLHAFLWTRGGGIKDLGLLGADVATAPTWINNNGQAVGGSCPATGNCRAFLYQDNTLVDLNTLVPAGGSLDLLFAFSINDAGDIVGQAMTKTGELHAYRASPSD